MQNYYQFIIPRLNGLQIKKDFKKYLALVKKGIAGFIIFGGKLEEVRKYIQKLQETSELPLIIASDLEQGLGQQIEGGTLFPPAMAIGSAIKESSQLSALSSQPKLLKNTFNAMADEAKYAGINTIFAPVLDINTNPKNPIICVRAFGEDAATVSSIGCLMIRTFQQAGISACGKHFPGHGDTEVDSHIKLPRIDRPLGSLAKKELKPFRDAIKSKVKMIMLGHLSVPAIDPSGLPVTLSEKSVRFIRNKMGYEGILITDAMNMGGIGRYSEEEASFMALKAGVDIVLHPSDPEKVVSYLEKKGNIFDAKRLERFRRRITCTSSNIRPDFAENKKISEMITSDAIKIVIPANKAYLPTGQAGRESFLTTKKDSGQAGMTKVSDLSFFISQSIKKPFLIMLNDDHSEKGRVLYSMLKKSFPATETLFLTPGSKIQKTDIPKNSFFIVSIFSETKAWKGGASKRLFKAIASLEKRADLFVSFGSPYLLDDVKGAARIFVYWDAESAQKAVAKIIADRT